MIILFTRLCIDGFKIKDNFSNSIANTLSDKEMGGQFTLAPDLCGRGPKGKARMLPASSLCRHCTKSAICFG